MSIFGKPHQKPMAAAISIVLVEVILINLPGVAERILEIRWQRTNGVVFYFFIYGTVLLLFTAMLTFSMAKSKAQKPLRHIVIAFYLATMLFFWSGIQDTIYGNTEEWKLHHDSIWYPIFAVFIFFFYLSLEYQVSDYPPLYRVSTIVAGISPAFFAGIFSLIEGVNYVTGTSLYAVLISATIMLLGLMYASIFGAYSYYKTMLNIQYKALLAPAQIQFFSLFGIALGLAIFAVDSAINSPLFVHFPIFLITFLIPLLFVYLRDPNYIVTLSVPVYEMIIVNSSGSTILGHKFDTDLQELEGSAQLKGGIFTALNSILKEITSAQSDLDTVRLKDRTLMVQQMPVKNETVVIALIVQNSCRYMRESLEAFADALAIYIQFNPEEIDVSYSELPWEVHKMIEDFFY